MKRANREAGPWVLVRLWVLMSSCRRTPRDHEVQIGAGDKGGLRAPAFDPFAANSATVFRGFPRTGIPTISRPSSPASSRI